jgi:DNA adenine methylase
MTLRIEPRYALLNDSNKHLIEFYNELKYDNGFTQCLAENTENNYSDLRSIYNVERQSSLFLWLNQCCFNGLYRENSKGKFNVPIGKNSKSEALQPKPLDAIDLEMFKQFSTHWEFRKADYKSTLEHLRLGTEQCFVYVDSPYDTLKDGFTGYTKEAFGWTEQVELAEQLSMLDCPIVASNLATDRVVNLYLSMGFTIKLIDAKRSISCNGDRLSVQEMIAFRGCKLS